MALREGIHLLFSCLFLFCLYYDLYELKFPDVIRLSTYDRSFGRLKFLTFWNVIIITTFHVLSLVNDFVGTRSDDPNKRGKLQKFLDVLFASIALPNGLFVATCFWSVYLYNRELMFPRIFDTFFPVWLNHLMHTAIVPAVLVEMVMVRHFYPKRKYGFTGLLAFFAVYLAWIHVIAYVYNFWTYPILEALNWYQRIMFFGACVPFIAAFYFSGEFLCNTIWGKKTQGRREKKKSRSKKKTT